MKFSVQVIVHPDDDTEASPVIREVFASDRGDLAPDTLGLQLAEAKDLLAAAQDTLVEQQATAATARQVTCPDCGRARRHKDTRTIVVRSLFGALRLASPAGGTAAAATSPPVPSSRWPGCCPSGPPPSWPTCRPASPPWSPTASPRTCSVSCCRWDGACTRPWSVVKPRPWPAQHLEDELGEEQPSFIDTCQRDREELPRPDLPIVVGLDGGYVHSSRQRSRTDGWFEVIAGKAIPADGRPACLGYVQTYDTKPKRRMFEVLKALGMAANQQVTFVTDGGEDIRDLPCYLTPRPSTCSTGST